MLRENIGDLHAFVTVAQARSFTRAAAQLGISRSALSHAMTALEARMGVRLLSRTTRSVSVTEAGARLLDVVAPRLADIDEELASLASLRDKPAGTVRITAHDHAIGTVLWPKLLPLLREYPDIQVEICVDYAMTDIAAQRFDAGVRLGSRVDKDMVAVRIAPDLRMAAAASPQYFSDRNIPATPKELTDHKCINLRLPTYGNLYSWEFEKDGQPVQVRVRGQATFNNTLLMLRAAVDGMGICYVPLDLMQPHIEAGRLVPVLQDWWPTFPGYHLYYANRRQMSPALALVVNALRYREPPV
ncbi:MULTISPECIES: LysR family transcriptional regulator [unclassified Variovorax]|jgi:DNA-binding transcriptional LysR family regulator|uniref:LysR family transcriptional regulator n=1 Tax=unclassified Variovorax TaxID=663243 RepID=UPI000F7F779F|nr:MULTISPECIES: LysR family transcriptional regulator [unclassified Variovorax]RSZ41040.1 LysR family transcriptional regulator [Variovorax sp. 553]RSZ42052.1 LysR family transcriptional regulator [Variovorax sp. 679]